MGIANYVNQDAKCWPTLETLSWKLGVSLNRVKDHIDDLVADGFMERVARTKKHYGVLIYKLAMADIKPNKTLRTKKKARGKPFQKKTHAKLAGVFSRTEPKLASETHAKLARNPSIVSNLPNKNNHDRSRVKTLDPEIKKWADQIYRIDPVKFKPLARWIAQAQKERFSDDVIAVALRDFLPYAETINGNWWPYLDKIVYKIQGKTNAREFEDEHEERKRSEADFAKGLKELFGGIVKDA